MIFSRSGSSAGVGFAVPADDIQRIVAQIINHGRVVLSGIGIQRVEPNIATQLGVRQGILIAEVVPNTPAERAKLRGTYRDSWGRVVLGDVIVAINAHPVTSYDTLYHMLSEIKVGEQITLSIQRGNKQMDLKLKTIDIAAL
jgi:S1-C subfamily serine protease